MTEVAPSCTEMTALAPPPAPMVTSRNASPARSPSNHSGPEMQEVMRDKDRRAQQQLDRSAEERGRKMEVQKRKEQQRRAAAGEKRRQQKEAEKERLEALVRRRAGGPERRGGGGGGGEARDHLDNRPKRWTWGGPPDGVEVGDFLSPPAIDQPINKQLSNSSAALHSPERVSFVSHRTASPNNHRPNRSSSNRRSIAGFPEETSRAKTPTGENPNAPARSSSFRANSKGPATPKRVRSNRSRAQSPCSPGQYPPSPLRQRATTPGTDDRGHPEVKGHSTLERKSTKSETSEKRIPKSTSKELNAESPSTPTGRSVGGTTDAEEASRLLAERRRLARIQKEQEERQRQEDERLRAEEEQRRQQEAKERQERAALQAEEEKVRREEERRNREDEERRQKEQRWKDMQDQLDREREEAVLRAHREAERKRQERELLHIQEEQERLQRKKRIEEIMKRTRKSEAEPLSGAAADSMPEVAVLPEDEVPPEDEVLPEDEVPPKDETQTPAPITLLGPLETKSFVDELSDGVQSMDVSPVSRDEQPSAHEFSPLTEGTDGCTLEHLMDLEAHGRGQRQGGETAPYPKLQAGSGVGDLNKNLLIQAYNAASESSQLINSIGPSKLDVQ